MFKDKVETKELAYSLGDPMAHCAPASKESPEYVYVKDKVSGKMSRVPRHVYAKILQFSKRY